jgi:hypothetical protein
MLITFKEIGYDRIDHHKRQIYLQPDGNLKVIDVARTVWRDRVYPYPRKLLTSFGEEYKELFLSHVQALSPELYEEWKHYIRMEELSRQIYQVLIKKQSKKDKLKGLSDKLLTTNDEQIYVTQLESLVHKVFKEEWAKTMLARETDPDVVMEKIDKHGEKPKKNNVPNEDNQRKNKHEADHDSQKTMLAHETDPDVVMEKIDKHGEKSKKNNVSNEDNQRKNKHEADHDSQKNKKSTNKGSYIGYKKKNKSNLKERNNRYQKSDGFPSHNRNNDNNKYKNWFNFNENSIKSKRQK